MDRNVPPYKKVHYRARPECLSHIPEQFLQHGFEQRLRKTDDEALRSQASIPGLSLEFQLDIESRAAGPTQAAQMQDQTCRALELERRMSGTQLSSRCCQCQINPVTAANAISFESDHTVNCTFATAHFPTLSTIYFPPSELFDVSAHMSDVLHPLTSMSEHSHQHGGSYCTSFPSRYTENIGAHFPATSPDHSFPSHQVFIPDNIEQSPDLDVIRNGIAYHRAVDAIPNFLSDGRQITQYITDEEFTMPNPDVSFNYPAY